MDPASAISESGMAGDGGGALSARLVRLASELFRFGLVGTGGFLVDSATLQAGLHLLGLGLYSGRVLSFTVAVTFTWYCNRHFTFRRHGGLPWRVELPRFVLLMLPGAAVNYGIYAALIALSGTAAAHPTLAVAAGAISAMLINFTVARRLVFRAIQRKRP
ncbi:MAG: GtrA family protein [Dongiaceae bacterium]